MPEREKRRAAALSQLNPRKPVPVPGDHPEYGSPKRFEVRSFPHGRTEPRTVQIKAEHQTIANEPGVRSNDA
ncbi:MAG: hypothetical protein JWL94_617 [Microbacteriaceae bacterium]|nr:hypothetical protein [Microbacteriaceae bacterium]